MIPELQKLMADYSEDSNPILIFLFSKIMKFVCIILLYIFVLISCNTRRQALKKNFKRMDK